MPITDFHTKYYANLLKLKSSDKLNNLALSMFDAKIDICPHQVEAALFAFKSPFSKGAILADEVGLGKTIEAGLILCQYWVERKRSIIIVCPSSLRKQWQNELLDKFNIDSEILESKSYNDAKKKGFANPFCQSKIIIISYNFANNYREEIRLTKWDLAIIDEAHKLRNVYKPNNKTAQGVKFAFYDCKKILLTATPIQNNLLELYGLSTILDEYLFGDISSFRENFIREQNLEDLKKRMSLFLTRTLRKNVLPYINYTKRHPATRRFSASDIEEELYQKISNFLSRENSFAIPKKQKSLITLVIRKILSSSAYSVAVTFEKILERVKLIKENQSVAEDFSDVFDEDSLYDLEDEKEEFEFDIGSIEEEDLSPDLFAKIQIDQEIKEIEEIIALAKSIKRETKAYELLRGLEDGFNRLSALGAKRKALIFTENKRTQTFLENFLVKNGIDKDKIVLFNGSNNSQHSSEIYKDWQTNNNNNQSSSKTANLRMALVDYFKNTAEIMIATEAGAEGVNMQFCSMVINYDLPWNPQRVEQRIGRCHRYGQANDVVVINFVNERNLADVRTFELLNNKFNLFDGVLGSSDEVLGSVESGVDFERRILKIYNECRTQEAIKEAFDKLQQDLEAIIKQSLEQTHQKIMENFDEAVHDRLKLKEQQTKENINKIEKIFWLLTNHELVNYADFFNDKFIFNLHKTPEKIPAALGSYELITKSKNGDNAIYYPYRINSGLGEMIIDKALERKLSKQFVQFNISDREKKISIIERCKGKKGSLILQKFTISGLEYEEYLLFNGLLIAKDGTKEPLDNEFCEQLFKCDAISENCSYFSLENALSQDADVHAKAKLADYIEKNDKEFADQEDKLYRWAEDLEKAKEAELEETKNIIKKLQRDARKATNMQEKENINLEIQKQEKNKRRQRQEIFAVCDDIENKRDELLKKLNSQKKHETKSEILFVIDFEIV